MSDENLMLGKNLNANIELVEKSFEGCSDIVKRKFPVGRNMDYWVYVTYIDGLANRDVVENQLLKNLIVLLRNDVPDINNYFGQVSETLKDSGVSSADLKEAQTLHDATLAMMSGDTLVLIDGVEKGLIFSAKGWRDRGVSKPETEMVIQGPKEAFNESIRTSTALIRRRIRDVHLKTRAMKVGVRSQTDVALVYLDDVVRPKVLEEAMDRLASINIDAILDSGYLEQYLEESKISPFPQTQVTERPDKAAAAILEGRIAIVVDGSPFAILIPTTISTFYQAAEDYYQRFEIMSFLRILRYVASFLAIALPGFYIALSVYHPTMIPSTIAMKLAAARNSIPFPVVIEIIFMEFAFELLKEAGIRLPSTIGSTLGIIGGIVVGQAAVEAGIVSPVVVIIVAITGICSFAIPSPSFVAGIRISKFYVILLSSLLGLYGFWIACLTLLTHLIAIKSFGIPYLFPYCGPDMNDDLDLKDSLIRAPLTLMKTRPFFANPAQKVRQSDSNDKKRGKS